MALEGEIVEIDLDPENVWQNRCDAKLCGISATMSDACHDVRSVLEGILVEHAGCGPQRHSPGPLPTALCTLLVARHIGQASVVRAKERGIRVVSPVWLLRKCGRLPAEWLDKEEFMAPLPFDGIAGFQRLIVTTCHIKGLSKTLTYYFAEAAGALCIRTLPLVEPDDPCALPSALFVVVAPADEAWQHATDLVQQSAAAGSIADANYTADKLLFAAEVMLKDVYPRHPHQHQEQGSLCKVIGMQQVWLVRCLLAGRAAAPKDRDVLSPVLLPTVTRALERVWQKHVARNTNASSVGDIDHADVWDVSVNLEATTECAPPGCPDKEQEDVSMAPRSIANNNMKSSRSRSRAPQAGSSRSCDPAIAGVQSQGALDEDKSDDTLHLKRRTRRHTSLQRCGHVNAGGVGGEGCRVRAEYRRSADQGPNCSRQAEQTPCSEAGTNDCLAPSASKPASQPLQRQGDGAQEAGRDWDMDRKPALRESTDVGSDGPTGQVHTTSVRAAADKCMASMHGSPAAGAGNGPTLATEALHDAALNYPVQQLDGLHKAVERGRGHGKVLTRQPRRQAQTVGKENAANRKIRSQDAKRDAAEAVRNPVARKRRGVLPGTIPDTRRKVQSQTGTHAHLFSGASVGTASSANVEDALRALREHTMHTMLSVDSSMLQPEERQLHAGVLASLGVFVHDPFSHNGKSSCTCLLMPQLRRVEKFLCALASGAFVVSPHWVAACQAAERAVSMAGYEITQSEVDVLEEGVTTFWRERAARHGPAFKSWRVYIVTNAQKTVEWPTSQLAAMQRVMAAGGAEVEVLRAAEMVRVPQQASLQRKVEGSHGGSVEIRRIILMDTCEAHLGHRSSLHCLANGVPVLKPSFVVDWLAKPSAPVDTHQLLLSTRVPSWMEADRQDE